MRVRDLLCWKTDDFDAYVTCHHRFSNYFTKCNSRSYAPFGSIIADRVRRFDLLNCFLSEPYTHTNDTIVQFEAHKSHKKKSVLTAVIGVVSRHALLNSPTPAVRADRLL